MRFAGTAWFVMPSSTAAAFGVPSCDGLGVTATCGQPAGAGDAVEIYLTGLGKATPNGDPNGAMLPTGQLAPASGNPVYSSVTKPTVTIGGVPANVLFAGLAPGSTGFYQVNVRIPAGVSAGDDIALTVAAPDGTSNTASIAIHP